MKRILAVLAIVAMSVLSLSSVAAAQYGSAQASYPTSVAADAAGNVAVAGFEAGAEVVVQLFDGTGALIGTVTVVADANGVATIPVGAAGSISINGSAPIAVAAPAGPAPTVPVVTVPPVPAKTGPIVTAAKSGDRVAAALVTPVQPTISTGGPVALASTGSEVTTPLLLGGALIAVGGMAIIASKRRESGFSS